MSGPRLGLRGRLAGAIFGASAFVVLVGGGAIVAYEAGEIRGEALEAARDRIAVLAEDIQRVLVAGDVEAAAYLVRALGRAPLPMEALRLYGSDGEPVLALGPRSGAAEALPPAPRARLHRWLPDGRLLLVEPVAAGSRRLGWVVAEVSVPRLRQHLSTYLGLALPAVALLLALSLALAWALQRPLSAPLLALAAAVREIGGSRDFSRRVRTKLRDEVGELYAGVNRMLDELEAAHRALAGREALQRAVLDNVEEIVYRVRLEAGDPFGGRVEFVNARVEDVLGLPPARFYEDPGLWARLIHPADQARVRETTERMLATGAGALREYRIRDAEGRWRWMEDRVAAERDAGGRLVALTGVARDVTERRRWSRALERLVGVVQELLETVQEAGCLYPLVARTARELVGADVAALSRRQDEHTCRYVAVEGEEVGLEPGACFSLEQGGLCGWVAAHGEPVRVADILEDARVARDQAAALGLRAALVVPMVDEGRVVGGISAFRREPRPFSEDDERILMLLAGMAAITLRMHDMLEGLEDRVRERTAELRALNRELESFAYTVSHDLRAPLRAIDGFSLALLEEEGARLAEEGREHLRRIRAAAQRMARLIDDLLALAQVTRGEMRTEEVDLSAVAREVAESLRRIQPRRPVEITVRPGALVRGDPRLLWTLMENLIGNAWKFTRGRDPARIEFGWEERCGERVFFVRDNGAGFDMAYAGKLFQPFQRLHSASEFEGTGIGLATVRRVVERHGGRVWAEGAVDRGATIYFTLGPRAAGGRARDGEAAA